jgi:hypothetical protein
MSHLSQSEIVAYIEKQWKYQISKEVKESYKQQAFCLNNEYMQALTAANKLKSELKQQIHDIKYSSSNPAVKPSGKLKFMSAYRFFRREMVPLVKAEYPDFDGKGRQQVIRGAWRKLVDECKFTYV